MSVDEIRDAISGGIMPLIHLGQDHGYESTLNYLSRLPNQDKLIRDLYKYAVTNLTSASNNMISSRNILCFLSRSNLAEEYKSLEVIKIKDIPIKLSEISSLSAKEVDMLYTIQPDKLIETCITSDCPNLFELYYKKVGLNPEELKKGYKGYNYEQYSGPFCLDNFLINLRYNFLLVKVIVY